MKKNKDIKIFYFPGEYPFCYYYRGYLPGIYSNQTVLKDFLMNRHEGGIEEAIRKAQESDVVVFQRPKDAQTLQIIRLLKLAGKKVIFDNDDTYLLGKGIDVNKLTNKNQLEIVKYFDKNIQEILRTCDGAIASTDFLAEEYRQFNPNVATCKNCIDPMDEYPNKKNTTGKFRIGFVGSVTSNDDYIHIKEQIKKLDDRGDITIVVMGVKYKDGNYLKYMTKDYEFWNSLKNIEWHPYTHITEYMYKLSQLALDVAIIPREDSYFNRAKSNLKFLEMSLLRIPVIAQGFSDKKSPYQIKDKKYMTIVTDNSKWYDNIIKIKDDYQKYLTLANEAHDYVMKNYNISTYAPTWTKTIKKLCKLN